MIRFKRGLAILLSTCMIGGMMPLPASAEETVSENIIQTESTENTENLENAQSENEKSSETESETTTDTEAEDTAIADVQTLIDALPDADSITEDNVENVTSQLDTIDEAKAELSDADMSQLDLTRYDAAINKVMALMGIKEENDSEIVAQANDSAGRTEQQSTDEEECKHEGVEITFNSNGFGNCPKCNTAVYQPATETTDKYDINDDGTKDTVYEISNAGQLYWFAGLINGTLDGVEQNTSANAILTADIIVNKNVLKSDGTLNEGTFKEWTPITGSSNSTYSGIFDGQNHTISGLYFNQEDSYDVGLFGRNNGKIANAGILDSYFYGTSKVGGVCGDNNTGTITNCYNTGSVSGLGTLGGVSGYNYTGSITNCYNTGNVSGSSGFVGGVSGYSKGTIINSYNAGSVSGLEYVGGVSGINYTGSITDCYNIGSVSGSEGYVGGVNGYNDGGTITNSYNAGSVSGIERYVGGVCGDNNTGTITNCYNTSSVSGKEQYVGGVIGRNESNATITNCYYDSTVYTGTAIGKNSSGTTEKVEGKTTDEFKTGEVAYLLSQGCSTGEGDDTVTYDGSIWGQALGGNGDTYPVLDITKRVYQVDKYDGCEGKPGSSTKVYSNQSTSIYEEHKYEADTTDSTKHKCSICNGTEEHSFAYELVENGNAIKATCSECGATYTVKLTQPAATSDEKIVYDGTEKKAGTAIDSGNTGIETIPENAITYATVTNGTPSTYSTTAPKNAGTYKTKLTLGTGDNIVSIEINFTIEKATPTVVTVPIVAERVYNPDVALADSDMTGGSVTVADGNSLAGTWNFTGTNIIPTVNNKGYQAVFTPDDTNNYSTVTRTITVKVTKATPVIAQKPTAGALTYGQKLSDSTLTGGKAAYQTADGTEITGTFAWKNSSIKPTAADSQKTEYDVTFTPSDKDNYNAVDTKLVLTVNKAAQAPNMPQAAMAPAHSTKKVGDITLPDGWSWQEDDKDTALADGVAVTANALYTGTDKGNYETESVSITITRSECEHKNTEIINKKDATCSVEGYTGDTYCKDCNKLLGMGKELAALGHDYKATVTKQPTTTEEGIRTYTCTRCNSSYTESIAKLPEQHKHEYTETVTKEPTCTDAGIKTFICSCGDSYTETIEVLGHSYTSKVTKAATTTEEGIMTYTCSKCGHSYTQPIAKLKIDDGNEDNGNNNSTSIKPYIKDDSGKEGWDVIKSQLEKAESGETVTVAMNGTSVVPKTVIDSIKGKDTTLVLDMGNGLSWKINGKDITDAAGDIDFGVTIGADAGKSIPVDVINNVTGERYSMNLSLAYDGEFGFTATLTVNMESKNSGMYANLFYYNEQTGKLEFVSAGQIDSDGNVELAFTHASDYTIVVAANIMSDNSQADNNADKTIPAPKTGDSISKYAWNNTIIIIIGICIILIVFGAVFYVRKKSGSEEQ